MSSGRATAAARGPSSSRISIPVVYHANPQFLTNVNGTLYFSANDGTTSTELWKSDGSSAGTVLVRDIRPGASGAGPVFLTNVNGTLYFSANDGTTSTELWKSDGSSAGTVLVRDIRPALVVLAGVSHERQREVVLQCQ